MDLLNLTLAPIIIIYVILMSILFLFIFNLFYLAVLGWRNRKKLTRPVMKLRGRLPRVTIQLPIYNEWYVAARLIDSVAVMDYPRELLEIQVLDDSTDETVRLISERVGKWKSKGVNIVHIHRVDRAGYKAGALANGLEISQGEFIAVFDADFVPHPDFLQRVLPHFDHDRVAFVQARWGHLNRDYSPLTLLQSFSLDTHFAVDQLARSSADYVFNFNGTAGVWRKSAIIDSGGWRADTLTEDMDLSYRAFLRGWSARYAGEIEVPAELPVSFTAYRRQQYRWARGSLECAIRYIPTIWRSQFSFARKLQATLHLTGYALHFLSLSLVFLYPLLLMYSVQYPGLLEPVGFGLILNFLVFAPAIYFIVGQQLLQRRWFFSLPIIFLMSVFASGLAVNTLSAVIQILQRRAIPFERTPKYGITRRAQHWDSSRYHGKVDLVIFFEIALALLNLWTAWFGWRTGHFLIMIYAFLFAVGLFFISISTLLQAISPRFKPDPLPATD